MVWIRIPSLLPRCVKDDETMAMSRDMPHGHTHPVKSDRLYLQDHDAVVPSSPVTSQRLESRVFGCIFFCFIVERRYSLLHPLIWSLHEALTSFLSRRSCKIRARNADTCLGRRCRAPGPPPPSSRGNEIGTPELLPPPAAAAGGEELRVDCPPPSST